MTVEVPLSPQLPSELSPPAVDTMLAPPSRGRAMHKNLLPFRTYVLLEKSPQVIQFRKHLLRFEGYRAAETAPNVIWGVYGTSSLNAADVYATRDATGAGKKVFQCEVVYRLSETASATQTFNEEHSRATGTLLMSRITLSFRKTLLERMHNWLQSDTQFNTLKDMDLLTLVKTRPMLIHRLLIEDPDFNIIIHPVFLNGGVTLRIATARIDPSKTERVFTRFHNDVVTTV